MSLNRIKMKVEKCQGRGGRVEKLSPTLAVSSHLYLITRLMESRLQIGKNKADKNTASPPTNGSVTSSVGT